LVSTPINIRKGKLPTTNSGRKTGAIVEEEIEKAKKEIKKSQQDLKSRKK
tara:strand:+ start:171 stop:320 length:150 start_codon:yes stop_codon:yes gene_type:complete